ncbi:hypothetical protein [Fuerstiella marisgermanici]|uniref:DUF998 domain-containing protein n=1 Tax=Fuerstiella marisgermanici TaxID=1891926 RepID=A0A1P8WSM1_9PLAN|nr:hypothetical protein [Fuerstiella marisgermanici]APZ97046.1 hypothetical protein Fuma_06724 [Fuerstiella marisgermanici]
MSDLYAAPESAREAMVENQHSPCWIDCPYRYVMLTATVASLVSATCVSVFYTWCEVFYGSYGVGSPAWTQFLCGTSFYSAGMILAVGFGMMSGQCGEQPVKLLWLAIGGFACLLCSEMFLIATANIIPWLHTLGTFANVGLRSATLCVFVCWLLHVRIRKWRLLALLLVGTPGWMIMFFCIGKFGGGLPEWTYIRRSAFNTAWTFIAAWQIWAMLLPPKVKTQERQLSREDFLPHTFSLHQDAPQLDIEA